MAVSQYNRYIWLVETIRAARKITRAEIDRKWMHSSINENHESRFPERSFFRCRNDIEVIFGIEIKCQRSPYGGQYYIDESTITSRTKHWLLPQFTTTQSQERCHEPEARTESHAENIRARIGRNAAATLRSQPLHPSQREIEPSIFEWLISPTPDFIQQLRAFGSDVEILEPHYLREQFKAELEKQLALYK